MRPPRQEANELTTNGGSVAEKQMVYALGRVIQERDNTDAVTARYYWGDVAAGNAQTVFKKDSGESAKYLVPEGRGSPLENLNKAGTLSGVRAYDAFGVSNYSSGTALTPFELSANMPLNGSHLTVTPVNGALYPELGRAVTGWFRLTHLNGAGWAGGGGGRLGNLRGALHRRAPRGIAGEWPPEGLHPRHLLLGMLQRHSGLRQLQAGELSCWGTCGGGSGGLRQVLPRRRGPASVPVLCGVRR
jgi:hypothetical protein